MGNKNNKSTLRNAIIYLNISADPIGVHNDKFWSQIFSEDPLMASEVIKSISIQEIRMLRDGSPKNFATLIYKMVERLCLATGTLCNTSSQQTAVLNTTRVLIRVIPIVFEDDDWRDFFEKNQLATAGDLRQEPELVFIEKDAARKDYASYLPTRLAPSSSPLSGSATTNSNSNTRTTNIENRGESRSDTSSHKESKQQQSKDKTSRNLLVDDEDSAGGDGGDLLATNFNDKVDLLNTPEVDIETGAQQEQQQETFINLIDNSLLASRDCQASNKPFNYQEQQEQQQQEQQQKQHSTKSSLMSTLIQSICDLLFCPEFTVLSHDYNYLSNAVDAPPEDLKSLSTCDYVWEPGVGFDSNINSTTSFDGNRCELMRLLLACLSVTLYQTTQESIELRNNWLEWFVSQHNRHTLPLFTSFLNVILAYKPAPSLNLPITLVHSGRSASSSTMFVSDREQLVELSIQILIATLDYSRKQHELPPDERSQQAYENKARGGKTKVDDKDETIKRRQEEQQEYNLFTDYLKRIHRKEDLDFLIAGFARLLGNRLELGGYLMCKKQIEFEQELLILFWKICSSNQRFVQHLLKSNEILGIILPLLYHMNENFQDPSRTALIHICVFNLLILSGERNFGVKLNRPYTSKVLENLPDFVGTHADLLIIVFHKLIMYGHDINQLYDYLMTIVANISPYLKNLNLLSAKCLIQLFETFSSVYVLFTEPFYHSMVVFLLEIFNNIIQYQFDGNTNLVYIILSKKELFIQLANMSTTQNAIDKVLRKLNKRKQKLKQLMLEAEIDGGSDKTDKDDKEQQDKNGEQQQQSGISKDPTSTSKTVGDTTKSSDNSNNSDNNNRRQNLATVSASSPHQPNHSSHNPSCQQFFKQEVSLVETPDLNHVTQPIHPYDKPLSGFLESNNRDDRQKHRAVEGGEGIEKKDNQQCHQEGGPQMEGEREKRVATTTTMNLVDDLLDGRVQFDELESAPWTPAIVEQPSKTTNSDDLRQLLLDNHTSVGESSKQTEQASTSTETSSDLINKTPLSSHQHSKKETSSSSSTTSNHPSSFTSTSTSSGGSSVKNEEDNRLATNKKWKPTPEWLRQWKQSLPLQTVLRTIEVLMPQIEQLSSTGGAAGSGGAGDGSQGKIAAAAASTASTSTAGKATTAGQVTITGTIQDESEIIKFLQNGTLVGLLPVPHPILIRKYRTNNSGSTLWFRSYTWGIIYVRNSIWSGTHIKLIKTI